MQPKCELAEVILIEEHDLTFKLGQPVSPAVNQLNPQSNKIVKQVDPSNQPSPNSWKARPVLNQADAD